MKKLERENMEKKNSGTWYLQKSYCKAQRTVSDDPAVILHLNRFSSSTQCSLKELFQGKQIHLFVFIYKCNEQSHRLKVIQVKNAPRIIQLWPFHSWTENILSPLYLVSILAMLQ